MEVCRTDAPRPEHSGRFEDEHMASTVRSSFRNTGSKLLVTNDGRQGTCLICKPKQCSCGVKSYTENTLSIPSKTMIMDFLIKSVRYSRRTQRISDIDDLNVESFQAMNIGSLTVSPSKAVLIYMEALLNGKELPKNTRTSSITKGLPSCRHAHLVEGCESTPRRASNFKIMLSELRNYDKPWFSRSSTQSISSCNSTLSQEMLGVGLLHCIWVDGLPCFKFSMDCHTDIYLANPIKVKSSVDKALDYIYLFHLGVPGKKDSVNSIRNVSRSVGKMKVSSSLVLHSDQSSCVETEFVFLGSNEDYLQETRGGVCYPSKSKGLVRKVASMIRPAASPRVKNFTKNGSSFSNFNVMSEGDACELKRSVVDCCPRNLLVDEFPTSHELAAVVVRESRKRSTDVSAAGGWGLKFLQKLASGNNESYSCSAHDSKENSRSISVVVPAGFHGSPVTGSGGPSSLTERWKSGGRCSCGGWDVGCPISVFGGTAAESGDDAEERSVDLSIQGSKSGEPYLKLVSLSDSIYVVYYELVLSPLQCFAIAASLVHAQMVELRPDL